MDVTKNRYAAYALAIVMVITVLLIDLMAPLGAARLMVYLFLPLLLFQLLNRVQLITLAVACTIMIASGFFYAPSGIAPNIALLNRFLAVFMLWLITILLVWLKKSHVSLFESELRYRSLFNEMTEGFALHEIVRDSNGKPCDYRFLDINPAFERLTGLKREELIGKTVLQVLPNNEPEWVETFGRVALSGESVRFERYSGELGRHYEVSAYSPQMGQFACLFLDITEQKRAEEERQKLLTQLEAEKARWQATVENMLDPVTVCDAEGRAVYMNAAYSRLIGRRIKNGIDLEEHPGYYQLYRPDGTLFAPEELPLQQAALFGKNVRDVEIIQRTNTGEEIITVWNAAPLRDSDGRIMAAVAVGRDVTQLKRAEEALRKSHEELERRVRERTAELAETVNVLQGEIIERENAEEALRAETARRLQTMEELREKEQLLMQQSRQAAMGEMIGNIAHQWRQPLNTLGLIIQGLQMSYELGDFTGGHLDASVKKAMRVIFHMSQTIDDFRNFFRPDKEKEWFDAGRVIAKTLSLIEGSFSNQKIRVTFDAQAGLSIYGYPNEFSQALLNILINARDALSEGNVDEPRVLVRLFAENGKAVVTISDNAGGVPADIMGKIFDPYFTTKGPDKGTGVGLFMSKTIVEKNMGGALTARNIGDGAEFRIVV